MKQLIAIIFATLLLTSQGQAAGIFRLSAGAGSHLPTQEEGTSTSFGARALLFNESPENFKFGVEAQTLGPGSVGSYGVVIEKIFGESFHTGISFNHYSVIKERGLSLEAGWEPAWLLPIVPAIYYKASFIDNRTVHSANIGLGLLF